MESGNEKKDVIDCESNETGANKYTITHQRSGLTTIFRDRFTKKKILNEIPTYSILCCGSCAKKEHTHTQHERKREIRNNNNNNSNNTHRAEKNIK